MKLINNIKPIQKNGANILTNKKKYLDSKRRIEISPVNDFMSIYSAYITDSRFMRAINKYVDLLFKNGYVLKSQDQKAYDYLDFRIKIMEWAMGTSFRSFLKSIAINLCLYDNCILLIHKNFLPNNKYNIGIQEKVIIGYEILHPATLKIETDNNGNIIKYVQRNTFYESRKTEEREFAPNRIIHMTTIKDYINHFLTPTKKCVIPDLNILRELEENCATLVQKFINPFVHIKIKNASAEKINQWSDKINYEPVDSVFISNDDINIDTFDAGNSINGEVYLKYFEDLVFTGLGVSSTIMGREGAANRATADSVIAHIQDSIRESQRTLEDNINMSILDYLMLENNFDIVNHQANIKVKFNEIDTTSLIAKNTHHNQMYLTNAITQDELRRELGRPPMTGEDLKNTFYHMFGNTSEAEAQKETNNNILQPANQQKKRVSPKRKSENTNIN